VRQVGGPSVSASHPTVKGKKPAVNGVVDPSCDATLDSAGTVSANLPSLDILASRVAKPDPTHYLVTVTVADLTSLAPPAGLGLPGLVWQTQWHVPVTAAGGAAGGHIFFAYMEATDGGAPTFWDGESASTTFTNGGNGSMTYPGAHQITGSYTATSPGTISITVPAADVSDAAAVSETLFSVTASTLAYPAPANSVPVNSGIRGVLFDTIDVSPAYDFLPGKRDARLSLPAVC